MDLQDYFIYSFPIYFLELLAIIAGFIYLKRIRAKYPIKLFVRYLVVVFIIEILASYSTIAYFSNYSWFTFVENTPFRRNTWIYNLYDIISPVFIGYFLMFYLKSKEVKRALKVLYTLFLGFSLYRLAFGGYFFKSDTYVIFFGTLLVLISLFVFFYEILKTDIILKLKTHLPFYIGIGILAFYLCTTPMLIFDKYFDTTTGNLAFVKFKTSIILISNVFMYSCFTIGFLICSQKKKSF